jgi:hypothetical protein
VHFFSSWVESAPIFQLSDCRPAYSVIRTVNCDGEMLTVRADVSTDPRVWRIYGVVTNAADEFVVVAPLRSLEMSDEELVKGYPCCQSQLSPAP